MNAPSDQWTVPSCPLCGNRNHTLVFSHQNRLFGAGATSDLCRCRCGLLLTSPRPAGELLAAFYDSPAYYTHRTRWGSGAVASVRRFIQESQLRRPFRDLRLFAEERLSFRRHLMRLELRHFTVRPGMRLLDFGCGSGELLRLVKAAGLEVAGVEPDPQARQVARGWQAPVVADVSELEGTFDRIVLSHVLEHLPEPIATLETLRERLRPGGLILVRVPNVMSLQAEVFGPYWIGSDMPRHFWHFSFDSLEQMVRRAGLAVVSKASVELPAFATASAAQRHDAGQPEVAYDPGPLPRLERAQRGAELLMVLASA